MTSHWRSENSADDVARCNQQFSSVLDSTQPVGSFYDDSLRPKSFLHDEVDEFNRVLAELLQRPQPTAQEEEDDFSSWSQNNKDGVFHVTQRDHPRTNNRVVCDSETQMTSNAWLDSVQNLQPAAVTHWTDDRRDDDDDDGDTDVVDDDGDNELEIVEEDDLHLAAKDCNSHSSHNIFTDDLFNEVSQENLNIYILKSGCPTARLSDRFAYGRGRQRRNATRGCERTFIASQNQTAQ